MSGIRSRLGTEAKKLCGHCHAAAGKTTRLLPDVLPAGLSRLTRKGGCSLSLVIAESLGSIVEGVR